MGDKKLLEKLDIKHNCALNWEQLIEFYADLQKDKDKKWIFRGQNEPWPLSSNLERLLNENEICLNQINNVEFAFFDRFIRTIDTYNINSLKNMSIFETIALMQHYGTPTRIVDFTYSFYLAIFFALKGKKADDPKSSVIIAIDSSYLKSEANIILGLNQNDPFMPGKIDKQFFKYFCSDDNEAPRGKPRGIWRLKQF